MAQRQSDKSGVDIDNLIRKIDEKIAEIEAEKEAERKTGNDKQDVIIVTVGDVKKTSELLKKTCGLKGESLNRAMAEARRGIYTVECMDRNKAEEFIKKLQEIGTIAITGDSSCDK